MKPGANEPTYLEYVKLIMELYYFKDKVLKVFCRQDLKAVDDLIEILRYYAQFLPKKERE